MPPPNPPCTHLSAAQKRSIILRDDSNRSIELTLWGAYADNPGNQLQQVGGSSHLHLQQQQAAVQWLLHAERLKWTEGA